MENKDPIPLALLPRLESGPSSWGSAPRMVLRVLLEPEGAAAAVASW
jgi:hypothetical protein